MALPEILGFGIGQDALTAGAAQVAATPVRDFLNDPSDDLVVTGGDLVLVGELPAIVQDIRAALQSFRGDWFLDLDDGLPYFDTILVKSPQLDLVRAAFRDCLAAVPGVVSVLDLQLDFNPAARTLAVTWVVQASTGVLDGAVTVGV